MGSVLSGVSNPTPERPRPASEGSTTSRPTQSEQQFTLVGDVNEVEVCQQEMVKCPRASKGGGHSTSQAEGQGEKFPELGAVYLPCNGGSCSCRRGLGTEALAL